MHRVTEENEGKNKKKTQQQLVLNNFIKNQLIVKSNDLRLVLLIVQTSEPHIRIGRHLCSCSVSSSRFDKIPTHDGRTGGRTDTRRQQANRALAYGRAVKIRGIETDGHQIDTFS